MDDEKLDPLTLKALFPLLKKWYGPSQKAKYGELPMFWQDLENWPLRRSVMKEFENEQQRPSGGGNTNKFASLDKWRDIVIEEEDPIESLSLTDKRRILSRIKFEEVADKLNKVVILAKEAEKDPNRSPSPDPVYNREGVRMNTREVRMRNRFSEQKKQLLDDLLRLKPIMTSQGGNVESTGAKQIQRKIYIPVKDFPGRNFIGLIIGPRGNTQKKLEQESGCKIAIRGKGSVKAGRQGKPEDEVDELHVIVTGDTDEAVDKAAEKVEELLRPLDDQDNVHKQQQLRDLAIYNGTFRDHETCHHCQEKGHKQWECPKKRAADAAAAAAAGPIATGGGGRGRGWNGPIVCNHCGERSHVSADCPTLRIHPAMPPPGGISSRQEMPQQYQTSEPMPPAVPAVDQSAFMDFWQDVSSTPATSIPYPAQQPPQPPAPQYPQYPPQQPQQQQQQQYSYPPQYASQPPQYAQPPPYPQPPPQQYPPAYYQPPPHPEPPPPRY